MRVQTLSWMSVGLLLFLGEANGATLIGTTLNPVGVTGLIINNHSYDITFSTNSYNNLFRGSLPPPIFASSDPDNAFMAATALAGFLRSSGVIGLGGVPCAARIEKCLVFVPTGYDTLGSAEGAGAIWGENIWSVLGGESGLSIGLPGGDAVCFPNGCDYYFEYAVVQLTPAPPPVPHAAKYRLTVLGKLSGGTFTRASAINNAGLVVGTGDQLVTIPDRGPVSERSAILWTGAVASPIVPGDPDGTENEAVPTASAINNSNAVVGSYNSFAGAFYWKLGKTSQLPGIPEFIVANGINDAGTIVGTLGPTDSQRMSATSWTSATSAPTSLPVLAGFDGGIGVAFGINAAGSIVGTSSGNATGSSISRATLWTVSLATDLGTLGGSSSAAAAINSLGHIVGWANIGNNTQHAALWEPTTRALDLGTLGGKSSYASGVNVEGDVVGSAQTSYGVWHAVSWTHKHLTSVDLNAEISIAQSQAITLTEAVGTNDKCTIVANGFDNATKAAESYVLTLADPLNCNEQ